jgi:thiosulfate/3-mercaptopyruvate sulfurtransferase
MINNVLVSTEWVEEHLDNIRLIQVDSFSPERIFPRPYDKGHIPGAVGYNWDTQLSDPVRRDIVSKEDFGKLLSQAGVDTDTHVVLYGNVNNWFAAYALWLFKYYGHENVSLMDGGSTKWLAEGRPFTTDVVRHPATDYKVRTVNADLRADHNLIRERLDRKNFSLVDTRSAAEFTGEVNAPLGMADTAQRNGHIPGATNITWSDAVAEDGTYKSKDELEELYAGVLDKSELVTYCRIGERSSHSWFALKYILGHENVRNYDGSWTEWGNMIGVPIANTYQG